MGEPPRILWVIAGFLVGTFALIPFGERKDWLGWLAFAVSAIALVVIWGAMLKRAIEWWCEPPEK